MSATQGGVTFVDMKECQQGKMLVGQKVLIHAVNSTDIVNKLSQKINEERALTTFNRNESTIFVNVVEVSKGCYLQLSDADMNITKKLFFVCQEQKDLLIKRGCGKILNIVVVDEIDNNGLVYTLKAGIENMTRGLAIATAANSITANTIFVQKSESSIVSMGETAVFLLSNCANDILGQIITF